MDDGQKEGEARRGWEKGEERGGRDRRMKEREKVEQKERGVRRKETRGREREKWKK